MITKLIRILIISDVINDIKYNYDFIDGTAYEIEINYLPIKLDDINCVCSEKYNIIISETFNFNNLKQENKGLNNNIEKNFFGFEGRFVLINYPINNYELRNYDTAHFPNCKTFKQKDYTKYTRIETFTNIFKSKNYLESIKDCIKPERVVLNDLNFSKFLRKEVKKYIAVEKDYIFTGVLFSRYMVSLKRSGRIWIQMLILIFVSWLFLSNHEYANDIKNNLKNASSFFGSHLFNPNVSAIRPVSIIATIVTCFLYWLWYIRDIFEDINKEISPIGFRVLYYFTFPLIISIILLLLIKLVEGKILYNQQPIFSYNTSIFIYKEYFIIGLLTLLDFVILIASRKSSKSNLITKHTETKLLNVYEVTFKTIIICDVPILIGSYILSYQEQFIQFPETRTAFQIGATASSLFILQLIYLFINWKSSYEDYLSS